MSSANRRDVPGTSNEHRGPSAADAGAPYDGHVGRTRVEGVHYSCRCGALFPGRVHRVVNTSRDPELGEQVRAGTLNQVRCPTCGAACAAEVSVVYHDEDERRFVLVLPESARTREMWERAELLRLLAEDASAAIPSYVREADVVFGLEGLLTLLEGGRRVASADLVAREQALEERARELDEREAALTGREGALMQQKRGIAETRAELGRQRLDVEARSEELGKRERSLARREEVQVRRDVELDEREARLREREARNNEREAELSLREARLRARESGGQPGTTEPAEAPRAASLEDAGEDRDEHESDEESITPLEHAAVAAADRRRRTTLSLAGPTPPADPPELGDLPPERTVRMPAPRPPPPPPPPPAALRRWMESGERTLASVIRGVPYLAAVLNAGEGEPFVSADELVVRVQLHRLPTYPMVNVVVLAGPPDDRESRVLGFPLDVAVAAERAVLENLASEFRVVIDLYGSDRARMLSHEVRAPLAENVRYVLSLADEYLESLPMPQRSFADARRGYLADGFDRLGQRPTPFSEDSFALIPSPAAARLAAGVIELWSERESEDYLVLVKSFPLPWWRRIRTRVLTAAVEHGIALPPRLRTVALEQGIAANRRELGARILRAATEVGEGQRLNDLDPEAAADNWRALIDECDAAEVTVEPAARELAAAAAGRASAGLGRRTLPGVPVASEQRGRGGNGAAGGAPAGDASLPGAIPGSPRPAAPTERAEAPPEQDLTDRSAADLLRELERKEGRKDAVLELCQRGDPAHLPAVFAAVRRMTRGEAIRVLPALVRFGSAAEDFLVEGLEARKSFLRQGCALALGAQKATEATDALVKLLLEEPTEIWREVARALGDIGSPSVMSLAARIREADVERRDRISLALAHVAARGGRTPVEALARGRDSKAAQCAQRALERVEEVKLQDAELRGGGPPLRETTMVRSFTRHFFDSLAGDDRTGGEIVELDASELLEEDEEELGDEDIVEEEEAADPGGPMVDEPPSRRRGRGRRPPQTRN